MSADHVEHINHPYRAEIRIKNNRVWNALLRVCPKFTSVSDAARQLGIHPVLLGKALNMSSDFRGRRGARRTPRHEKPFGRSAELLAAALRSDPEYLFDYSLYAPGTVISKQVFEMSTRFAEPYLPRLEDPYAIAERNELKEIVDSMLSTNLTPREERIVRRRFGIGVPEETAREIADEQHVTSIRISQIMNKSLKKLRHPSRSKKLRSFIESQ